MLNLESLPILAEGKTKIVYANPKDDQAVYMFYKDDITAGDGVKRDIIKGKGLLDWKINRDVFGYLNRLGVRTHYMDSPEECICQVKKLDLKVNLEVVSRRVATGSIIEWGKAVEGTKYDPVITQFHYKDDSLHDPMLDNRYIDYLIETKGSSEYAEMRRINADVLLFLEKAFAAFGVQLLDLKLEYGIINGKVHIIDEISGGSLRLWPYRQENPDLNQENVINELDPDGRLDKDTYRMGEGFDKVMARFETIAKITENFKECKM